MKGSHRSVENPNTWRQERVAEAANLARCLTYRDLAPWQRVQEVYTEARRTRGDDGEPGGPTQRGPFGHALRIMRTQLVHLVS